ncbi:MAG: tRNA (adenosine(37)-N6)-threonylcarbamoyltransferase complex dimerization subunit type 1 TsaB [Bacteroidota bacterium]
MALILSIDTSTTVCSIALHNDGTLLSNQSFHITQSHSKLLSIAIDSLIEYTGYHPSDLNGIALSKGPGSYTGLRIGTSTAKGLCYALDVPLIAINTLEAMALQVSKFFSEGYLLCPMIDARRMEVYTTLVNHKGNVLKETTPEIIDQDSFKEALEKYKVVFFGNGAAKCASVIEHPNATFLKEITPDATSVGLLGYEKYNRQEFEDVAYFEPFYLKEFMATKPKNG